MTNPILTPDEIDHALTNLERWAKMATNDAIHCSYKFASFDKAMTFMTSAVPVVEQLNHHPRWTNSYNRVTIELTTHNNGAGESGITRLDIELATALDRLFTV